MPTDESTREPGSPEVDASCFSEHGFVVIRKAFEPGPLRRELDAAIAAGAARPIATGVGSVQYVPMMCSRTPCSLALLDLFSESAARLLGGAVLPVRAKGMRYHGATAWHADSARAIPSVGFAAYLEPLDAENGALRVVPGSHRPHAGPLAPPSAAGPDSAPVSAVTLVTEPGDVIAFDQHLLHSSSGGTVRRQWRVDYVRDPTSPAEAAEVSAYFADIFPANWDGQYDPSAFPSYGDDWMHSARAAVARLGDLGVYQMAVRQEHYMKSRAASRAP